ncbi:MAG: hypothetical protein IK055_04425 [Lachnospiraceae bacterium]|nr:hypothetical protein [Lachnospiraceae bacterium]
MKKRLLIAVLAILAICALAGVCAPAGSGSGGKKRQDKVQIKVLILPKFEVGQMTGDTAGEAQYYYEAYVRGGEEYTIAGVPDSSRLYVKDGIALYLTGMGKVDSALNTAMLLSDDRFDFSNAYVLSTGCAGSAVGYGVMGDVFVLTATVDYDLGHHADPREMKEVKDVTWFHENDHDNLSVVKLNADLTGRVYDLVKDVKLETTEKTRRYMRDAFAGEAWADREPQVLRGTGVTGDNFWKGRYDHANALAKVEAYGCADPFATTEMEDMAVTKVIQRFGLLDRYIILRDSVNIDIFMDGDSPETLWDAGFEERATRDDQGEVLDIFDTAMRNNFKVGKVIIDAILSGEP